MTDGDGARVTGQKIRIAGIDAPELNQKVGRLLLGETILQHENGSF